MLVEQEQIVTPLDQMGNVTTLTLLGTTAPMLSTAITKGRLLMAPPVISVAPPCSSIPTPVMELVLILLVPALPALGLPLQSRPYPPQPRPHQLPLR